MRIEILLGGQSRYPHLPPDTDVPTCAACILLCPATVRVGYCVQGKSCLTTRILQMCYADAEKLAGASFQPNNEGQNTTSLAPLSCQHPRSTQAPQLTCSVLFSTRSSAGSLTSNISSRTSPPRPTSSQGLRPQPEAPPCRSRGCSTLLSYALPSPTAARPGGPRPIRHFFERVGEMSCTMSKTCSSVPSQVLKRRHWYEAFKQRSVYSHCYLT